MNYKESKLILEEVKKAKRILLNCHKGPDPDSIGSALAIYGVLRGMGKIVEIICPSKELYNRVNYLANFDRIQKNVNFSSFDFSKYDIFVCLDSSSWDMVADSKDFQRPDIKLIQIDHHNTNTYYADINLVDPKISSVGELIYLVFEDWRVNLNKLTANCLMTAIIGDTGAFRYPSSEQRTLRIAADLMDKGADKEKAIHHIYRSEPFDFIKFYGEVLTRVKLDKKNRFVWAAIPYNIYKKLNKPASARESASSLFAQITQGTDFGIVMAEEEKDLLKISFRSRTGVDTSKMAVELGGGGHIYASGARVENLPFDKAVKKVLKVARKFAKKNASKVP